MLLVRGFLVIEITLERKHIQDVILLLGYVGQMMEHRYYLLFGGGVVNVFDGWSIDNLVVKGR